jgi:hypothetical protein
LHSLEVQSYLQGESRSKETARRMFNEILSAVLRLPLVSFPKMVFIAADLREEQLGLGSVDEPY